MGLFDIFKKKKIEQEVEDNINQVKSEMFPGGQAQVNKEIEQVFQLLNKKYLYNVVANAYTYGASLYHISNGMNLADFKSKFDNNPEIPISSSDVSKIYNFLQEKYNLIMQSNDLNLNTIPEIQLLYIIALGGIQELKLNFDEDLTEKGKFEVLLFNSIIVLQAYKMKNPQGYDAKRKQYYELIIKKASEFKVIYPREVLLGIFNERNELFALEMAAMFNDEHHTVGIFYSAFYHTPLRIDLEPYGDLTKLLLLKLALTNLVSYLYTNVTTKL